MTKQLEKGQSIQIRVDRMAHGGEGIGKAEDGRIVFVRGAAPGDTVTATLTKVKKSMAFAEVASVVEAGEYRTESSCPAADAGAGCCDFSFVVPEKEPELKSSVLRDQLGRVAKLEEIPAIHVVDLLPHRHWRTRVRLGVDPQGRAGLRKKGSHELVTDEVCTQLVDGLVDGIVGDGARRFTPGSEVIVVLDSQDKRHVVESRKASRGRRVETITRVIEGSGTVVETADDIDFSFPATAFWQAHGAAPDEYAEIVRRMLAGTVRAGQPPVGWDLYGGVGLFVPALAESLEDAARAVNRGESAPTKVISVDYSPAATAAEQPGLSAYDVEVITNKVEKVADQLIAPTAVVLDPPRTGAGKEVISTVAAAGPARIVHIGCDPATFARDVAYWGAHGYEVNDLVMVNAFPGTSHFETLARLVPAS